MKVRLSILSVLTAAVLPISLSAQGIADLANPDDIMLRKPAQRVEPAKPAADAAEQARIAAEKAAAEKQAAEKAAAEKLAAEKAAAEKQAAEKAAAEKQAAEKAAAEKLAAEQAAAKAEADRKEKENAAEIAKLREQVAASEKARQQAEAKAKAEHEAADEAKARAQEAEAAALAAKKKKLEAPVQAAEVVAADGNAAKKPGASVKVKKTLTGRSALIKADRTDYDRKEGVILFDRNVYVDDEQYQMHADRLFVFLDGTNDLKRIVAIGNVSITNESKTAACAKAVYSRADQRIVMYAENEHNLAWLRDSGSKKGDASEVSGLRITYWFDSEVATVEGIEIKVPGLKGGGGPKDLFGPKVGGKNDKKKNK